MHVEGAAFRKSTNTLEIRGLTKKTPSGDSGFTSEVLNNATVKATVYAPDGVTKVTGVTPITLEYVASSAGRYAVQLSHTLDWSKRGTYVVEYEASTADGLTKRTRRLRLEVLD